MLKLILFDMDGTIVQYETSTFHSSWDAIAAAAGPQVRDKMQQLLQYYYYEHPELDEEWFKEDCRALQGSSIAEIETQIFPPPYTRGFPEFCSYLQQKGIKTGMISSGVDLVAKRIQEEQSLDFIVVNELGIREGKFTGEGKINVPLWNKGKVVRQVLEQNHGFGISRRETAYFGDHENDLSAWQEVDFPYGINLKKPFCREKVLQSFLDFREVLPYFQENNQLLAEKTKP